LHNLILGATSHVPRYVLRRLVHRYQHAKERRMVGRIRLLFGISVFWLALSMLFDGLNTLVLPVYLLGTGTDRFKGTILGLLTFAGLLLGMLVQPVAGAVSDRTRWRWGRRGMIALGVLLTLAALGVFGAARGLAAVFAGYLLVQGAASLAQAAQQGFIPDLIAPEHRGSAAGLKGSMDLGGALLGFVVLGQLLEDQQTSSALLAIAAVLIVTAVLTFALVREQRQPANPAPVRVTLRDAFQLDLRRHRAFAWLVVARFLFLLGTYAVGRFLLYFVADRLRLDVGRAAGAAGELLAALTLLTLVAMPLGGWIADRFGRMPLMVAGALLSAAGVLLLIGATSRFQILIFGSLMAIGSAAFASANWALTADLAPPAEAARFFGLANIGTAGAAAAAGLFGPLVDWGNTQAPEAGYTALFLVAGLACAASALALRGVQASASTDYADDTDDTAGKRTNVPPFNGLNRL
jgi:MFS family permease